MLTTVKGNIRGRPQSSCTPEKPVENPSKVLAMIAGQERGVAVGKGRPLELKLKAVKSIYSQQSGVEEQARTTSHSIQGQLPVYREKTST